MPVIDKAQEVMAALRGGNPGAGGGLGFGDPAAEQIPQTHYDGGSVEDYLQGDGYELAARVESLHEKWMRERMGREREAFEALAFYAGNQHCVWDADQDILRPEGKKASWMIRRTINKVKPIVQHVTAILVKDHIRFSCSAATADIDDLFSGEAAKAGLEHYWRRLRMDRVLPATFKLAAITGTCAHELEWDEFTGPKAAQQGLGSRALVGSVQMPDGVGPGGQLYAGKPGGSHRINILTLFNLVPDPKATGDDDGEALFVDREASIQWLRERFPEAAPYLRSEPIGASNIGLHYLQRFQAMASRFHWGGHTHYDRDSCLLKTLYLPRSARYPRGRMLLVANHTLLADVPNPIYPEDPTRPIPKQRWPVFIYRHDWDGVSFWGRGLVPDLIDLQRTINELASKATAIVFAMASPKYVAIKHNEIRLTDKPGEVVRVPANFDVNRAVTVLRGGELPQSLNGLIALFDEWMREIAGIREATMGEAPSARSSGVQLDILRAQDAGRLEPTKDSHYDVLSDECAYLLALVQRYVPDEDLVRISGTNHATAVRLFRSADTLDQTDVRIVVDTRMPDDAIGRANVLKTLRDGGFLTPESDPHDKQLGLELMDVGAVKRFQEDRRADLTKAERENMTMESGLPPRPSEIDNHLVHFVAHANFMKTERYEGLDLATQSMVRAHTQWHLIQWLLAMQQGGMPGGASAPGQQPGAQPPGQPQGQPGAAPPQQPAQPPMAVAA